MMESENHKKLLELMAKSKSSILDDPDIGSHLSDFEILQVLGEGGFGFVAKVKSKKNFQIYAMKTYDLSKIEDPDFLKYYKNESLFMKELKHPNVCRLCTSFKENNIIYMIMEFMDNGDLFTFLNANMKLQKRIKEEKLWNIFEQCLKGLVYIHSKGLIHRDIKPANLLINNEGQVKLSDFNVSALSTIEKAKNFTKDIDKEQELLNQMTQVGSGNFQAPEVKENDVDNLSYNEKIDVYSMGITFCSLAFYKVELPPNAYNLYSKELVNIIKKMIHPNYFQRPSALEIYNDFIKAYVEKYIHSTGLISCINCLTLYDSFTEYFFENGDNIGCLNEISFQLNKIIKKKYYNNYNDNNQEQKSFNYLLFEFRELLYKNGIKKIQNGSNEIEPISIISLLLKKMHEELNVKKNILGRGNNFFKKIFNTDNHKQDAYLNFMIFYTTNFESIISNNFFGLIKTKRICNRCKYETYTFNMLSFIPFNIKILTDYYSGKKNNLNINDAFDCLNTNFVVLDEKKCVTCDMCNIHTEHNEFKQFYNLPKNLIIFFDRGENYKYKNFINFDEKLDLTNNVETFARNFVQNQKRIIYNLIGIICREEKEYKDKDDKLVKNEKYYSFSLSNNCYIDMENNNNIKYSLAQIKKIGMIVGLFYYCNYVDPNFNDKEVITSNLNLNLAYLNNNMNNMDINQNNVINNGNINANNFLYLNNNDLNPNIRQNQIINVPNIMNNQNMNMNNFNNNGFIQNNNINNFNNNGFNRNINNNGFNQNNINNSNNFNESSSTLNDTNFINNSNDFNDNMGSNQNNRIYINNFNNNNMGINQNNFNNNNNMRINQNNMNNINNFNNNNNQNNFNNNMGINQNNLNNNNIFNNMGFNQNNNNINNNNMRFNQNNINNINNNNMGFNQNNIKNINNKNIEFSQSNMNYFSDEKMGLMGNESKNNSNINNPFPNQNVNSLVNKNNNNMNNPFANQQINPLASNNNMNFN